MIVSPLPNTLGIVVKCEQCPHFVPEESQTEWTDSDGTVYFQGSSPIELQVFMEVHGGNYLRGTFLETLVSRVPQVNTTCRCGHEFSEHSFYGESRTECHGEIIKTGDYDGQEVGYSCSCGSFQGQPYTR